MCGIVGVISKTKNGLNQQEISVMSQLLYADALRGADGTGVFFNTKKNRPNIKIVKQAAPASWFLFGKEYTKAKDTFYSDSNFVIGHNRSATKGKVNQECTHPFREKHITLVHNGTLITHKELNDSSEVDSHAICVSMADKGEEETLKEIDGAFALVWFNAKEQKLNLCRNSQRPLHIIETWNQYIISSELELALWIIKRNNLTVKTSEEVKINTLYSFNLEDMGKFTTKDIKYKSFVHQHNYQTDYFPKQSDKQTWRYGKRIFDIGERVKFKTSGITRERGGITFLMGDLMRFQSMDPTTALIETDFEGHWRVKVIGKEADLLPFALVKEIKGKITGTSTYNNETTFFVEDLEIYKPKTNILTLPIINKNLTAEEEGKCGWCDTQYKGNKEYAGTGICDDCWGNASWIEADKSEYMQ